MASGLNFFVNGLGLPIKTGAIIYRPDCCAIVFGIRYTVKSKWFLDTVIVMVTHPSGILPCPDYNPLCRRPPMG